MQNHERHSVSKVVAPIAVVVVVVLAGILGYGLMAGTSDQSSSSNQVSTSQTQTTVTTSSLTSGSSTTTSSMLSTTTSSTATRSSSLSVADSTMAKGVDSSYQPINRTQAFGAADRYAFSWIKLVNVYSPSHNITWTWSTPWGQVYAKYNTTIADPGSGKHYPNWYADSSIYIKGSTALYLAGTWQVNIYIDGAAAVVQSFSLDSPYVTPQGIRNAYNIAPLIQSGYTGKGVNVAIINSGIDSTFYSDIQGFDAAYSLPDANITVVMPDGNQGTNAETPPGETTADVEFVHAMAPDAHILLVLVGSASLFKGFSYVIDNNVADVATVSPSWAWWGQANQATVSAENSEFATSVGKNITLIAASNDWGSNNTVSWGTINGDFWTAHLPYSWLMPQYSPYFTAVGGTALTLRNSQYGSELGWNQSGGGPSNLFAKPSWQTGPGVPQNGWRDIPDISLDASCATAYTFFWQGHLGDFCGTSGGAPTFAGIVADIIQAAGHRVGFLNPTLYSLASSDLSSFHDVTAGCSLVNTGSVTENGYCASGGWDYVTGLGSPDAVRLLKGIAHMQVAAMKSLPTGTPSRSVSTGATSAGLPDTPCVVGAIPAAAALTSDRCWHDKHLGFNGRPRGVRCSSPRRLMTTKWSG